MGKINEIFILLREQYPDRDEMEYDKLFGEYISKQYVKVKKMKQLKSKRNGRNNQN